VGKITNVHLAETAIIAETAPTTDATATIRLIFLMYRTVTVVGMTIMYSMNVVIDDHLLQRGRV
jgi:hypothetical protein